MEKLAQYLIENNISISSVESFTVGNFASLIGKNPGISKVYKGSIVSYQNEIKHKVVKIDQQLIDKYGVVSSQIAKEMAINTQKIMDSDLCVSFTGNAGPSVMENKEAGLIYIGIAYKKDIYVYEYLLSGSRDEVVKRAINIAIKNIKTILNKDID